MPIPAAVSGVYITEQLFERTAGEPDYLREKLAVRDIASQMAYHPSKVLPRLVDLAIDLCGAVAGGISIYEQDGGVFRWHHLRGTFERFSGATTPRDYSPCGIVLDHGSPILVQYPERVYSWLAKANVCVPECLLVPLYVGDTEPLGTLWIVSGDVGHFNEGHSTLMQELAGFTGIALQMIRSEERLKTALDEQEILTREMGHRVKNLFAITDGMIRLTAKAARTKEELAEDLSGRLHALSGANALVRPAFDATGRPKSVSDLSEVISVVLKPYVHAATTIDGPPVKLGEHATNAVALIYYELATNAAKYGALGIEPGTVIVTWRVDETMLDVVWTEAGGPAIASTPQSTGFGTALVENTVKHLGGRIANDWRPEGVQVTVSMPLRSLAA